jgi:hypothetical protein
MTEATTSIAQWLILVVAAGAIVVSVAGLFLNVRNAREAERELWQRDLRVRIYGACAEVATRFEALINTLRFTPDFGPEHPEREIAGLLRELGASADQVHTFGEDAVAEAAIELNSAFNSVVQAVYRGSGDKEVEYDRAITALRMFRRAIRQSLGITDQ